MQQYILIYKLMLVENKLLHSQMRIYPTFHYYYKNLCWIQRP